MNIYIACGLTHVPRNMFDDYCKFIHSLSENLYLQEISNVKYALINSDPQLAEKPFDERARLCYYWDKSMVEEADVIIAEASFPSTGLGIELQIAANKEIPIILCFMDLLMLKAESITYANPDNSIHSLQLGEGYVSLMALGLPNIYKVVKYHNKESGIKDICEVVKLLDKNF